MNSNNHSDITILIVDDETLICQRIALHVERAGYTIIGFAKDGREASHMLSQYNPDIVITDISMPLVSGIQLLEQARKDGNSSRFIFITGFDEFSYALSALKNRASDYLLKPVDPVLLLEALEKAYTEIITEQKQQKALCAYGNLKDASLLYQMLSGTSNIIQECSPTLQQILEQIENLRALLVYNPPDIIHTLQTAYFLPNGLYLYFIKPGGMEIIQKLTSEHSYLALGNPLKDLDSLRSCFPKLRRTLLHRLFTPSIHIYYLSEIQKNPAIPSDFSKQNRELLEQHQTSKLRNLIPEEVQAIESPHSLERYTASLVSLFRDFASGNQGFPWQAYSPLWILERFKNRSDYIEYMQTALDSLYTENYDTSLPLVERIKEFLSSYYSQNGITLETIGMRVFAHPNYVSTRFKKETGMTVIAYLTELRLKKAKILLETTKLSCSQISYLVGFQDQSYFSRCFKKQYRCPPTSYQTRRN